MRHRYSCSYCRDIATEPLAGMEQDSIELRTFVTTEKIQMKTVFERFFLGEPAPVSHAR